MRIAYSTAVPLSAGSAPGSPRDTGDTAVLGSAPNVCGAESNILVRVPSSTCTSMPITGSKRAMASS